MPSTRFTTSVSRPSFRAVTLPHITDPSRVTPARTRPRGLVDWSYIDGKGRGVIALQACAAGTEVERSPVIIVPASHLLEKDEGLTVLEEYLLYWGEDEGRELAMGEGLLMIYNHSSDPNVEFETGPEPDTMSVIALRDIAEGEELTYDYGVTLWFEAAAI